MLQDTESCNLEAPPPYLPSSWRAWPLKLSVRFGRYWATSAGHLAIDSGSTTFHQTTLLFNDFRVTPAGPREGQSNNALAPIFP